MSNKRPIDRFKSRLAALNKRADFLIERIKNTDVDLTYDKQELGAIIWAIAVIEKCPYEALNIIKFEGPHEAGETNE